MINILLRRKHVIYTSRKQKVLLYTDLKITTWNNCRKGYVKKVRCFYLQVIGGVPVYVVENESRGSDQIEADTARLGAQQKHNWNKTNHILFNQIRVVWDKSTCFTELHLLLGRIPVSCGQNFKGLTSLLACSSNDHFWHEAKAKSPTNNGLIRHNLCGNGTETGNISYSDPFPVPVPF